MCHGVILINNTAAAFLDILYLYYALHAIKKIVLNNSQFISRL